MSNKVILVVIDGLRYRTAVEHCGFMEGLVEGGRARRFLMRAALPSMSAPCYETLHTGVDPVEHGITANSPLRQSNVDNVFSVCRANGRKTAAVAYSFFSVLYNGGPFTPVRDLETDDPARPIQHGRFYDDDGRQDFHLGIPSDVDLCTRVGALIERTAADYILLHTLTCDSVGHVHGGDSWQYRRAATLVDVQLARHVPAWLEAGYNVLVTADHGFTDCGYHGGTEDCVRDVPFYAIGHPAPGVTEAPVSQRAVAPTVLTLMDLPVPAGMRDAPLY